MPKLTINGIEVEVPAGTSIIQAAEEIGVEIPRFCYHDRLSVPANCRMCLVEVEGGPPKPVASCAMACADNMVVKTDSPMVKKARKGVMEFLLINHPLDCPICDQGGECDLQDQAMAYGFDRSRYHENKRAVKDKQFGPLIKTSMNRCIQCTRCIRFGEQIGGVSDLGLLNRGEDVEIGTFIEKAVSSELSGNMIDVCPVGALISKPYAFKARPWELRKTDSIDVHDAVGSNIRVDSRGNEVMRILPRLHEDINEVWIGDKTRFAYDGLKYRRLDQPWVRDEDSGKLRPAAWEEALSVVAQKLTTTSPDKIAALAGDMCDVESMVALKDLMAGLNVSNLECRLDGARFDASERVHYLFNSTIAGIEDADAVLIIGTNPRWEAAMLNARIRKSWLENQMPIGLVGPAYDLTYPYEHLGTGPETLKNLLAGKSDFAEKLKKAERPLLIIGSGALARQDGPAIHALAAELAEKYSMIGEGWNGFNMLHQAAARVGGLDIGFWSDQEIALDQMDVLYLLGADEFDQSKISKNSFVIYQGHHGDIGAHHADVILPGAAYTEKTGLYVNTEGRVQQANRAVNPPGEAREDWKIIRALSGVTGKTLPYNDLAALRGRIVKEWPHLGQSDLTAQAWQPLKKGDKIKSDDFVPVVTNYYQTNPIARASVTMAKCVEAFLADTPAYSESQAAE